MYEQLQSREFLHSFQIFNYDWYWWLWVGYIFILHNICVRDDCCSMSVEQFFSYITMRISYFLKEMVMISVFVLDQHIELNFLLLTLWNNSPQLDISLQSTLTHYPDSDPSSIYSCSFELVLIGEAENFSVFGLTRLG